MQLKGVKKKAPLLKNKGNKGGGGEAQSRVHKRCTWLGAQLFGDKGAIDDEAIKLLSSIDFNRAMEMTKELEDKGASVKNPSGYLKTAVKRELAASGTKVAAQAMPVSASVDKQALTTIRKRCTWLSANVFEDKDPIDDEAKEMLAMMDIRRALELCKEAEEKASEIKNPSGYLKVAAQRALGVNVASVSAQAMPISGSVDKQALTTIRKRCTWLSANVFEDKDPIDDDAKEMLATMDLGRALELCKEAEEKASEINNPSGYLKVAAQRALFPDSSGHEWNVLQKRCTWLSANKFGDPACIKKETVQSLCQLETGRALELLKELEEKSEGIKNPNGYLQVAVQRALSGAGASGDMVPDHEWSKLHKRCTWLGANVFGDQSAITEDAIRALGQLDLPHALDLLNEVEEKGTAIKNPSGYLIKAATNADHGGGDYSTVHKRCTWLGANVFGDAKAIEADTISALSSLETNHALEILKELEEKSRSVKNPSGYLNAAVQRALRPAIGALPIGAAPHRGDGEKGARQANASQAGVNSTIHKRCTWLSANVFGDKGAITEDTIEALSQLEVGRALDLLTEVEEKGASIKNPSGYLKKAAMQEPKTKLGGGSGGGRGGGGSGTNSKLHKRCTWLGANVFGNQDAIDEEAIAALSSIDVKRALEITDDLQKQGSSVKNPSGYLKTAVKRELGQPVGGSKTSVKRASSQPAKHELGKIGQLLKKARK